MEAISWDGSMDEIRLRARMTPPPPYADEEKDALTYELRLRRLGKSSVYRIEHELLANFFTVESQKSQVPFKLLERDSHQAVVYSTQSQSFEAQPGSVPEEETLLSIAAGPFTANRFVGDFQKELANWKIYQYFHTDQNAPIRQRKCRALKLKSTEMDRISFPFCILFTRAIATSRMK